MHATEAKVQAAPESESFLPRRWPGPAMGAALLGTKAVPWTYSSRARIGIK